MLASCILKIPELLPIGLSLKSRSAVGILFFAANAELFQDLGQLLRAANPLFRHGTYT
jgi:hypothetical protein